MFSYAQDFFVKKMACNVYQRIGTQMTNFSILNTKHNLKRKCQLLIKFYVRVRQFREKCDVGHFRKSKSFLEKQLYHKNKNQQLY